MPRSPAGLPRWFPPGDPIGSACDYGGAEVRRMSQGAHIRRNSFFAFLSQLIRLLTNVLMFVGIARLYGVEAFGQFTTAHTLSTIFLLFADFGFDMLLPTEIARHKLDAAAFAQRYFSLKMVFAIVATVAMMTLPLWKTLTPETTVLVEIFAAYVLFSSLNNFFFALFKGFEQFHHETKISFWTNATLLVLLVVLGIIHAPLYAIAMSFVGTRIIGVLSCARIGARLVNAKVARLNFDGWRDVWHYVLIFGLNFIFGNLFFQIDTVMLAFYKGDHDVGIYQSVFKIVGLSLIAADILVTTMAPVLARLDEVDRSRWNMLGALLNKTMTLLALPMCVLMFVYPDQIIALLYGGKEFAEAVPLLRLFSVTVFTRYSVDSYAIMLTTSHRQTTRMFIVMAGTAVNVALNIYMIPAYGPMGAATASLITNVAVGIGYVVASGRPFLEWTCEGRNLILFGLTVVVLVVLWQVRSISFWYTAPVVAGLYALAYYRVGFTREQLALVLTRDKGAVAYQ
jgi:O-antigen/teichoic acid export membrane protein